MRAVARQTLPLLRVVACTAVYPRRAFALTFPEPPLAALATGPGPTR